MTVSLTADRGLTFTRAAIGRAIAGGRDAIKSGDPARHRWPDTPQVGDYVEKTVVGAINGADLIGVPGDVEFLNLLRPRTVLGRLSNLRRVPFNKGAVLATVSPSFAWIGNGRPIPVSSMDFSPASLEPMTLGGLIVLSGELLKLETPASERLIREEMLAGSAQFMDFGFLDPDSMGETGYSPASITSGANSAVTTGNAADDLRWLVSAISDASEGQDFTLVMSEAVAFGIGLAIPGAWPMGLAGGLFGIVPVILTGAAEDRIIALHGPSILFAEDDSVRLTSAGSASIQMLDNPTNNSTSGTATNMISMFQTDSVALRLVRTLNWSVERPDAVVYVSGVTYGGAGLVS